MSLFITGQEALLRQLHGITEGLLDQQQRLEQSAMVVSESILENFVVGGRPDGWPDILPESRDARKFDHETPPLWDGGDLAHAATSVTSGVKDSAYQITPDSVTVGVNAESRVDARRHQDGFHGVDSLGRKVDEPARPYILLQSEDKTKIVQIWNADLTALLRRSK